jgi:hypothetical protein|nr:MAG TPA: hypothetical protein [Caudoviricetes sp.]
MDGTFFNALKKTIEENTLKTIDIEGHTYLSGSYQRVDKPIWKADTLEFHDLDSLITMLENEITEFRNPMFLIVKNHTEVSIYSALDERNGREKPYTAKYDRTSFRFGQPYDHENFIIALRSQFVQNEDSKELLEIISRVKDENSVEQNDDGVSQTVVARQGVSLVKNMVINPIRKLRPYRTFSEVEQPESEFLFRIMNGKYYLFEADGGAWENEARNNVKKYLEEHSKGMTQRAEPYKIIVVG